MQHARLSLFLDEIGEVSVPVQVKLLDVLHDRTFTTTRGRAMSANSSRSCARSSWPGSTAVSRVADCGAGAARSGDIAGARPAFQSVSRVIAATNRPLAEMRYEGNFRDDFFYRLTSNVVQLPSLRQRIDESPEEFVLLVSSLVSRTTEDADGELTALVLNALENQLPDDYPWPGNVRELEQVVRSVLMAGKYMGIQCHWRERPNRRSRSHAGYAAASSPPKPCSPTTAHSCTAESEPTKAWRSESASTEGQSRATSRRIGSATRTKRRSEGGVMISVAEQWRAVPKERFHL